MQKSILRQVLFAYVGFGAVVAGAFPFYANFFVTWKPGMLPWFVAGCFVAGLLIGVANYWVMNLVLVSKLRRISQVASAIAGKDLRFTCAMQSDDTIGEIITSFNDMATALRELLGQTSTLSSQVRRGSEVLRSQASEIHGRVDRLAERTHGISASIQELETAIADISSRGQHASQQAAEAGKTAREGVDVARESIEGIEHIHQRVSSATTRVQRLEQSSQEVGSIVAVIREIADQTNLLALNAAIEAARAGEQGRGFAVVADEVRKLAEKTSVATNQISEMIRTIQAETRETIGAIGESLNEAERGVGHARSAGEALERIIQVVDHVDSLVTEIAEATALQQAVAEDLRNNVSVIEKFNGQTLNDAQEGMTLAAHLVADANRLDAAVKSFQV